MRKVAHLPPARYDLSRRQVLRQAFKWQDCDWSEADCRQPIAENTGQPRNRGTLLPTTGEERARPCRKHIRKDNLRSWMSNGIPRDRDLLHTHSEPRRTIAAAGTSFDLPPQTLPPHPIYSSGTRLHAVPLPPCVPEHRNGQHRVPSCSIASRSRPQPAQHAS